MVVILMIFAYITYCEGEPNEQKLLRQEYGELMKCSFYVTKK